MPDAKIPELLEKLISVSEGNLLAIASLADDVAGGHIKKALESTQSKFDAALAEDTRDALLETMKLVQYNATTFRIVQEIIGLLHDDVSALQSLTAKWAAQPGQTPPDLRDVVVGAATIAPTYASSTGPLRRMYIEALRGSFAPEIFTFAFGPELLDALIVSGTLPGDIDTLITLSTTNNEFIDLNELRHGKLDANRSELLEVCERLAKGGFVDLLPQQHDGAGPVVVRHRTEALHSKLRIVMTRRGHRLLTMMKAGRGK